MRKLIAAMNMTLDGYCDHTAGISDEETHQHYADMVSSAGTVLYGRITYQMMENYWPNVVKNPTGKKSMDEFAAAMDSVPKIIFSNTLKNLEWKTAKLATKEIKEEVLDLKQQAGKDIFACSPSLILTLTNLKLIDEFQLCIHPVILGRGLTLFKNLQDSVNLKLIKTKTFGCGAVLHYYEPLKNDR